MNSFAVIHEVCKFCLSNGESEAQYRSHLLKNRSGLVTCPVLRVHVCPFCGATGDFAHTQRYCPLNKDGQHNSGASLVDLKKKKNAAGTYPSSKKMYPSHNYPSFHDMVSVKKTELPKMTTAPLPSNYRPPTQLYNYLQYHNTRQLQHQAEVNRLLSTIHSADFGAPIYGCYARIFAPPVESSSPPQDRFIFTEMDDGQYSYTRNMDTADDTILKNNNNTVLEEKRATHRFKQQMVNEDIGGIEDNLGNMLAELREGTEEVAMF